MDTRTTKTQQVLFRAVTFRVTGRREVNTASPYDPHLVPVITVAAGEDAQLDYLPDSLQLLDTSRVGAGMIVRVPEFPVGEKRQMVTRERALDGWPGTRREQFALDAGQCVGRYEMTETVVAEGLERTEDRLIQYWRPGGKWWFYSRREIGARVIEGWLLASERK